MNGTVKTVACEIVKLFLISSGGNNDNVFLIDVASGRIMLTQAVDMTSQRNYIITVMASDAAQPPNTDTTKVEIEVVASDPVPVFLQPFYTVTLEENLQPPQLLVDLDTNDEIAGTNVRYFVVHGGRDGKLNNISPSC